MKNARKWGVNPNLKPKTVEFSEWKDECNVKCQFDAIVDSVKGLFPSVFLLSQFLFCGTVIGYVFMSV